MGETPTETVEKIRLLMQVGDAAIAEYLRGRELGACGSSATNALAVGRAAVKALELGIRPASRSDEGRDE